jgi:hypothetical protein
VNGRISGNPSRSVVGWNVVVFPGRVRHQSRLPLGRVCVAGLLLMLEY